jgi:hypothetical protein
MGQDDTPYLRQEIIVKLINLCNQLFTVGLEQGGGMTAGL